MPQYGKKKNAPGKRRGRKRYTYMGNFWQISATVALTSSAVPSKSLAVSAMQWAIRFISSAPRPRVVTAAVPILTPLVTEGFWGSPGMAFLFSVMWLASQRYCSSAPVMFMGRRSASIR